MTATAGARGVTGDLKRGRSTSLWGGGAPCPKIFEIGLLNDAFSGHQNAKY